jgi:hypothetical protein
MMTDYLLNFKNIDWDIKNDGLREKIIIRGEKRMRLAEFSPEFNEADWCCKGHFGYLIEGSMKIDFDGKVIEYAAGDGFYIPGGEFSRHRAIVDEGNKALLLMIED